MSNIRQFHRRRVPNSRRLPAHPDTLRQDIEQLRLAFQLMQESQQELTKNVSYLNKKLQDAYKYLATIAKRLGWAD